jgi:hypothetical protein
MFKYREDACRIHSSLLELIRRLKITQRSMQTMRKYILATAVAVSALLSPVLVQQLDAQGNTPKDFVPPTVFQSGGPTTSSIQSSVEQFRAALGGNNNANNPGPIATGRREINWDGGSTTNTTTTVSPTPFTGFLQTRGALFTTRGTGFVQAPPSGLADTFGNTTYQTIFQPFSLQRLFSPIGSNVTEVRFFVPVVPSPNAAQLPATVTGFGAVFSDVDQPDGSGPGTKKGNLGASTLIEYFGVGGKLLFSSFVPSSPGNATFSFFGIVFPDARVAGVRITSGDTAPGPFDDDKHDIVVMDDFLYGEPQPIL